MWWSCSSREQDTHMLSPRSTSSNATYGAGKCAATPINAVSIGFGTFFSSEFTIFECGKNWRGKCDQAEESFVMERVESRGASNVCGAACWGHGGRRTRVYRSKGSYGQIQLYLIFCWPVPTPYEKYGVRWWFLSFPHTHTHIPCCNVGYVYRIFFFKGPLLILSRGGYVQLAALD